MRSNHANGPLAIVCHSPMSDYPRVLFVTPVAFNPFSGGGATFSSLFQGWPKDRLATVHNDRDPSSNEICENYYFLGPKELDFIPPLNHLRRRPVTASSVHGTKGGKPPVLPPRARWLERLRQFVLGDSIPEQARLTPALERWVADFKPELIYTILGSNGMMALVEQIRRRFDLPLAVHMMDDWPSAAHRKGLFAPIERPRMQAWLDHFFAVANGRFGISPAMCEAYSARYRKAFIPFQYALDVEQWSSVTKSDLSPAQPPSFLYIGSIFPNAQLDSLIDCARAIAELNFEKFEAKLRIVTSAANNARFRNQLLLHPNITVEPPTPGDRSFFESLTGADALLLPVNFDPASVDFIRYSMPTKVPAYLNSGTPVIAYGSAETAQLRYAIDSGWALAVTERSMTKLKDGLKRIVQDRQLRQNLSSAARKAMANHDARIVRCAFQDALRQSAKR